MFAPASLEKLKLADVALVGSIGCAVIETLGATVSTVQVKLVALLVLPPAVLARTENVWLPSARSL